MAKRIYARSSSASDTKNRILQELQNEGDRLIQQMQAQLARALVRQLAQSATSDGSADDGDGSDGFSSSNFTALFSTAVRYLFLPQAKVSAQQTSRSVATQQQFRLSQSQAAAEANAALVKAQKNT